MNIISFLDYEALKLVHSFAQSTDYIFTRPFEFLTLFCSLILSSLITGVMLKNLVCRQRPFLNLENGYYAWWRELKTFVEGGYSFPSGHATLSAAFSLSLIFSLKKPIKYLLFLYPLAIGLSRIYLLAHFPSDVFAGFLVGFLCSFLSSKIINNNKKVPQ